MAVHFEPTTCHMTRVLRVAVNQQLLVVILHKGQQSGEVMRHIRIYLLTD